MTKLNTNREVSAAVSTSNELQRLRTFNTLLLDTLRELNDVQPKILRSAQSGEEYAAYIACMKKVKKVIA